MSETGVVGPLPNRGGLWVQPDVGADGSEVMPVDHDETLIRGGADFEDVGTVAEIPRTRHFGHRFRLIA